MAAKWEQYLERWIKAGLIDQTTATLIREYEAEGEKVRGLRWPVLLAVALGGLLLAAGILLFVAAHWERLSTGLRFTIVLSMVAVIHIAGAAAARFDILSTVLHAVGTICLGAGIFLAGQIFHLQEHWPGGVMLWAAGTWIAWALLNDWPQAAIAACLTPAWLAGEWSVATRGWTGSTTILYAGLLMLSISYMTAILPDKTGPVRKVLLWIGGLTLIPAVAFVIHSGSFGHWHQTPMPRIYSISGWAAAFLLPLIVSWFFRGRRVGLNIIAALWVASLCAASLQFESYRLQPIDGLLRYLACFIGSIGIIAWGMKEHRRERVNLGVAGFALTTLFFYFSTIMDKLGRSASLIGLGLLFLVGGWLLEKARRRLILRIKRGNS